MIVYPNQNKLIVSLTKLKHDQGVFDIKITHRPILFWLTDYNPLAIMLQESTKSGKIS